MKIFPNPGKRMKLPDDHEIIEVSLACNLPSFMDRLSSTWLPGTPDPTVSCLFSGSVQ